MMFKEWALPFSIAVLVVIFSIPGAAAEEESGDIEYRHRLELLLGGTHEDGEDGFTSGLTYEYRITELFGAGAFVDYAAGDIDKWAAGLPFFIHPYRGLRFLLAPGIDDMGEENQFLFKLGVAYEFEFGRWTIVPEFDVNLIEGGNHSVTYGVAFGFGF